MASNSRQKSGSSGSRRASDARRQSTSKRSAGRTAAPVSRTARAGKKSTPRPSSGVGVKAKSKATQSVSLRSDPSAYRAIPGGRAPKGASGGTSTGASSRTSRGAAGKVTSVRVGDLDRALRSARSRKKYRHHIVRIIVIVVLLAGVAVGGAALYFSDTFAIEEIQVEGADHLTANEMGILANVPSGTTLLRVDAAAIEQNLLRDAWVKSVSVNRLFPHTLQIVVTERSVAAVVEVPTQNATSTQPWAIASDGMWLMAIPDQESDLGKSISQKIYEDIGTVLHITDVPYGTTPEIGVYCTDGNVNNALDIVAGMTTSLADQVTIVSATDAESTKLTLDNGVEIAFGAAENIREKERVCLEILEQNPDSVAYINVRVVGRPTWRGL